MFNRRTLLLAGAMLPLVSKAHGSPVTSSQRSQTPYDFGAKGGAYLGTCSLEKGATVIPDVTAKDAGKVVMIANGELNAKSLVTRVKEDGTLLQGPARDLINASYHIGHDDTQALQLFLAAGGGIIPDDIFLCQKPPLKYGDNCDVVWRGTILVGETWPSGFALLGNSYDWSGKGRRIRNVSFRGEGKNAALMLSPAYSDAAQGRKGIGITCTDDFEVSDLKISGGIGSLFALQIHYSTSGTVKNCRLSVDGLQLHQGSDGIHFVGNCQDIHVIGLHTWTGDDSSSQTSEVIQSKDVCIQRITYEDCVLENYGHSSIKGLITAQAGASIIQDIKYLNCRFITQLAEKGNGQPFIIQNDGKNQGAIIRRIFISGGETIVDNQSTKQIPAPAIVLKGVDDFEMHDHSLQHCGRTAIAATDCSGLVLNNVRIVPKQLLSAPALLNVPVVSLSNCEGSRVDTSGIAVSYKGQALTGG